MARTGAWQVPDIADDTENSSSDQESIQDDDSDSEDHERLTEDIRRHRKKSRSSRSSDQSESGVYDAADLHRPLIFEEYLYAKKTIQDFRREIRLLTEFASLNSTAVRKIVKKYDRRVGTSLLEAYLEKCKAHEQWKCLWSRVEAQLLVDCDALLAQVTDMKPHDASWEGRKVFSIGCFDLFHRGHENMLRMLREFGTFVVVGVHDDESYFKLKNKKTIHNTQQRVEHVKNFADMVFVIPDTNPTPWIRAMVSKQDVEAGRVCYVRGEDMIDFPGRDFVEANMPVFFLPRSEGVSSTLLRTIYHDQDASKAEKAAFARTDATGKPILEEG
ncbi:uncharacterized protein MONBRDRAFT_38560 [Monosiga brevicollis MX1]|uniref:SPX domain-containing protein n=1 Tax=Monosiga brevicollis TaxID=81824 RepID=A9V8R4_MONBE|nr:uncharacterized protein MONBRDRAFT_38560 [Monosiga brevicollis MX1]EDQ86129.1 predicted protein [Monosiga brevicollis MX1]|eukprot:XP_001749054.1 hypothetical protein [Monosiga brevicollis MX1]